MSLMKLLVRYLKRTSRTGVLLGGALMLAGISSGAYAASVGLSISVNPKGGYTISAPAISGTVLEAQPAIRVDGRWIYAADYASCASERSAVTGELGAARESLLHCSGLHGTPELLLRLREYQAAPYAELQLSVRNTTAAPMHVQALRMIDARGTQIIRLGGDAASDRVLSDSFSEDRPGMQLRDLGDAEKQMHRAVGSQLIYNRQSHQSWFIGALTSEKFLSVLRLRMSADRSPVTRSYEVESTGTTELLRDNSLQDSPEEDKVELSMPLAPGAELSSERMLIGVSDNYHDQLETYGRLIRDLHHARVTAPTPLGWWSWTAYYFGLNQGTALTNAQWLAQHLKSLGFTFMHIDEGYQYARGEYATPDAQLFPDGLRALERQVAALGLTPGVWTAPFEVSERSWLFEHHPEWLVHNAKGAPIHLGLVAEGKDQLYALDPTHPGAQAYLHQTYSTLVNDWGVRYIKMDFMEDSAVEGYYHAPNTTALEAQRIGIATIRAAVGDQVLLDKDGSELLNPVGLVDMGRISQDTGHTFSSGKDAASGIAARYYMNRNYFVADPDAFSVSRQTVDDQSWHGGQQPLTLDEAKVSIALTAVSGGMFEIGDDLPTLAEDADRLALVQNADILDIARLGRASTPIDLMSYSSADQQPSIFLLRENERQSVVTVFNWTDAPRTHSLTREQLGLKTDGNYRVTDIFDAPELQKQLGTSLELSQPPHSVRLLKIMNTKITAVAPSISTEAPTSGKAGETLAFRATPANEHEPVLRTIWDFGDGVQVEASNANHTYTHSGTYTIHLRAIGIAGIEADHSLPMTITGAVGTKFIPEDKHRLIPSDEGKDTHDK